jgi:toxin-antitoxin system PIN domain toxin
MILLDVNVLVYAHREDMEGHSAYRAWLEQRLDDDLQGCAFSELVLSGCLRILTHPKIFDPPTPLPKAMTYVEDLRDHRNTMIISPGANHWRIFCHLCTRVSARGNVVSDAYHAALAIESGCEWISTDRGFARFEDLRWRHPLDPVRS